MKSLALGCLIGCYSMAIVFSQSENRSGVVFAIMTLAMAVLYVGLP